jgi:hypothetical protein
MNGRFLYRVPYNKSSLTLLLSALSNKNKVVEGIPYYLATEALRIPTNLAHSSSFTRNSEPIVTDA